MFRVKDNGIGIGPDLLPNVFDLFAQANRSLHRAEGGLGIGLTIVRGLAELHGGRVSVCAMLRVSAKFRAPGGGLEREQLDDGEHPRPEHRPSGLSSRHPW